MIPWVLTALLLICTSSRHALRQFQRSVFSTVVPGPQAGSHSPNGACPIMAAFSPSHSMWSWFFIVSDQNATPGPDLEAQEALVEKAQMIQAWSGCLVCICIVIHLVSTVTISSIHSSSQSRRTAGPFPAGYLLRLGFRSKEDIWRLGVGDKHHLRVSQDGCQQCLLKKEYTFYTL